MKDVGLNESELGLMISVFRHVPEISEVVLYGSRAMGTFRRASDIDLALVGIDDDLRTEAVAEQLDELPLPYKFDVRSLERIHYDALRDHIARVGLTIYKR